MTDRALTNLGPFRTPKQDGAYVGWARPVLAVLIGLVVPSLLGWLVVYVDGASLAGPPKDGSGYSLSDHFAFVAAFVAGSILITWIVIPLAVFAVRALAMLGWAGWGTAVLMAWAFGLPVVHVQLNGDVTTEAPALLPDVMIAIAILALSVWAVFWGLMRFARPLSP